MESMFDELCLELYSREYIKNTKIPSLSNEEKNEVEKLLEFYSSHMNLSISYMADAYEALYRMTIEESLFFVKNGRYRYSLLSDVINEVYNNATFMQSYMIGLTISDFLWPQHLKISRYFDERISEIKGDRYLEIGPGFGFFFLKAIRRGRFNNYIGCDLSETSAGWTNKYLEYLGINKCASVKNLDFFSFSTQEKFDFIVMGEVLEHVENPLEMLKKASDNLSSNGLVFATVPINAPMIDHIYLFNSLESVFDMVKEAGFVVDEYIATTEGEVTLDLAIEQKRCIIVAMFLRRDNRILLNRLGERV